MALIRCPECLHEVSDNADKCPNCGFPVSDMKNASKEERGNESNGTSKKKSKIGGWIIAAIVIVFLTMFVRCVFSTSNSSYSNYSGGYSSDDIETTAYILSKEAVKSQLKAPSTAKFCKQSECTFVSAGTNKYMMTGWVDAENGFGAMLRADWAVVMELDGTKMKMISATVG